MSAGLVDEDYRTLQLSSAVLAQSSRLLSRSGGGPFGLTPHPVAERTFWERKLRLAEAMAADRPEEGDARQMVADAQTKLAELRRSALHVVPEA